MPRYIDVDALKKDIRENYIIYGYEDFISDFFRCLDEQPTVDVESIIAKHEDIGYEKGFRDGYAEALEVTDDAKRNGHWILQTNGHGTCSTCGTSVDLLNGMIWEYCPQCGAKMDEEEK